MAVGFGNGEGVTEIDRVGETVGVEEIIEGIIEGEGFFGENNGKRDDVGIGVGETTGKTVKVGVKEGESDGTAEIVGITISSEGVGEGTKFLLRVILTVFISITE